MYDLKDVVDLSNITSGITSVLSLIISYLAYKQSIDVKINSKSENGLKNIKSKESKLESNKMPIILRIPTWLPTRTIILKETIGDSSSLSLMMYFNILVKFIAVLMPIITLILFDVIVRGTVGAETFYLLGSVYSSFVSFHFLLPGIFEEVCHSRAHYVYWSSSILTVITGVVSAGNYYAKMIDNDNTYPIQEHYTALVFIFFTISINLFTVYYIRNRIEKRMFPMKENGREVFIEL
jgi:hypothetical protein